MIDRCRDDMPGAMFVYAVPPQFINEVVPRYPALQQRCRRPLNVSRVNHFSPRIHIDHLDLAEDALLLAIWRSSSPLTNWRRRHAGQDVQYANAAILECGP